MRFACIEYTTKSGRIWRPTPERPNYLCDPEREIDPTSFGCYTSALDGEHIPLTGLIYGSLEWPPSRVQRARQDLARRFRGAFRPYDLRHLGKFDVLLVIYQTSNGDELVRFVQRVREAFPDTILVSCSSPPFGRLRERWKDHPEAAARYRAFIEATHVNMNVCRATVPWYRAFTDTPSLYLPQPYPVEYALSLTQGVAGDNTPSVLIDKPTRGVRAPGPATLEASERVERPSGHGSEPGERGERGSVPRASLAGASEESEEATASSDQAHLRNSFSRPILYVAGDTVRPDIMTGHLVAKVLQERHPELVIRVTKTPEFSLNTAFLRGTRYEVVPFRPWAEQLRELAQVRLVINTDLWWTRGRVPVDCAAAGVPCVGTTSDGQAEVWPDLAADESLEVDRLANLAERALTDEGFRAAVVAKAQRRLSQYTYARTVERFQHAVTLARENRLSDWRDPQWEEDTLVMPTP